MARIRIAVVGASSLLVLAAALGGAEAQTGAPLPLLQIDHATTAVHAHHKAAPRIARAKSAERTAHKHFAKRVHARTRVAEAGRDLPAPPATPPQTTPPQGTPAQATPPQTVSQNGSQNIWPAPAAVSPGNVGQPGASPADSGMAAISPAPAPAGVTTEQVVDTSPNGILNGGHTVPAAMPAAPTPAAGAPKPQPAAAKLAAPSPSPPVKVAAATPAAPKPAVHAMLFRPRTPTPVGSASWIAQLLAALGGAIAAGAVAWFLIRPTPERNFG